MKNTYTYGPFSLFFFLFLSLLFFLFFSTKLREIFLKMDEVGRANEGCRIYEVSTLQFSHEVG